MDYQQAIAYIIERSGYDRGFVANPFDAETIGLRRTTWLLEALGNPQAKVPAVHVAGTKGKGSTAAFIASILHASGRRVGLYTSPHLHTFRERVQIDGQPIGEQRFADLTAEIAPLNAQLASEKPDWGEATAFEVSTALAFLAFARENLDVAVVEVGLGGRLDATNVLDPRVSVITSISYDHVRILGDTLGQIASEKGGIIKPGRPVVVAPQRPEASETLLRIAHERGSELLLGDRDWQASGHALSFVATGPWGRYDELQSALVGRHQVENAGTAIATCWVLDRDGLAISEEAIRAGLRTVSWPGRFEVVRDDPLIVVDGAHNVDSAERLAETLVDEFSGRRLVLVLGIAADKDVEQMVRILAPLARTVIATASHHPRAASASRIVAALQALDQPVPGVAVAPSVADALNLALVDVDDPVICATGSLYVVAEAREALGLAHSDEFERALLYR
ncbi:MAG TPA: folylpolyglutamate synthase/dihydrofolate synthase family protein [Nitrolancea sp.]|jgi:dihydrofolate synthase/folylpolyglutamate synthase|nr:folylpolyglutamate synthase/dihydrofolate synthase family protein [Nitrolancea sp.]